MEIPFTYLALLFVNNIVVLSYDYGAILCLRKTANHQAVWKMSARFPGKNAWLKLIISKVDKFMYAGSMFIASHQGTEEVKNGNM